jgi:hypothetical protein
MYHIIGGDGQEYGPVSAEQIRQWIAEGRLSAQSQIREATSTDWRELASFPEFVAARPATAPPRTPGPIISSPYVGGTSGEAEAKSRVSGPAIALLVTGIIGLLLSVGSFVLHLLVVLGVRATTPMPAAPSPELQQIFTMLNSLNSPLGLVSDVFSLTVGVLIVLGALKMKNLQSYTFAYTISILAMIPCLSPCCLIGLPFGIWALVVLNKPEIKSQFN